MTGGQPFRLVATQSVKRLVLLRHKFLPRARRDWSSAARALRRASDEGDDEPSSDPRIASVAQSGIARPKVHESDDGSISGRVQDVAFGNGRAFERLSCASSISLREAE